MVIVFVFEGNGREKRVMIYGMNLDISDYDPETTYLEICYDQGLEKTKPRFVMPGIGQKTVAVDNIPGYEKIIIPFDAFTYVINVLDYLILKGEWGENAKICLKSIKLICDDRSRTLMKQ